MSKGNELAKNTAIISIGKISTQLVSFLLLPLYTAVLSTEEYGVVDLVVTYVQLLLPVVTIQLEQSIFRFILEVRNDEKEKKRIFSQIFTLTFIILIIFTAIYLAISPLIQSQFKYFLLINLLVNVYTAMMLQTARGLGMNGAYALGSFISASGQVVLNVFLILIIRLGATGMLLATFIAYFLSGTFLLFKTKAYKYIRLVRIRYQDVKEYLHYSLPLVPNVISWWILNASDRTIILKFINIGANGIYSAANKFSGIYTTIYNIFNLSWTEIVALHMHEENSAEEFTKLQSIVVRFFSCLFLGLTAVMPFVFSILVDEKYSEAYYQIPPLIMGAFFSAMTGVIGAYYIAAKMTAVIAKMTFIAAIFNIVINLAFIQIIGLFAASLSTLLAYFIVFVLRYFDVRKRFGVKLEAKLSISILLMAALIWVVYYSKNLIICGIVLLLTIVYSVFVNRGLLHSGIGLLKQGKNFLKRRR